MTYLRGPFGHDLFVSYAHGRADRSGNKKLKRWSERLTEELDSEIGLLPEFDELDIFIDSEIDPTAPLTQHLRTEVSRSGLLLVIMSQHYLKSAWCEDEREWFEAEVQRRGESSGIVLVVRSQSTDHTRWPSFLRDERGHVVLGFQFHPEPTKNSEQVQPYGWPEPLPQDRAYYEELGKLAGIVIRRLQRLARKQNLEDKAKCPRVQISIDGGGPTIYLHAPSSNAEAWASAKINLEDAGCRVLPESFPAVRDDMSAILEARKERLRALSTEVHALCLLRTSQATDFEKEIEAVLGDRVALQAFDKDLLCAIIDYGVDATSPTRELNFETIEANDDSWPQRLLHWLQSASDCRG